MTDIEKPLPQPRCYSDPIEFAKWKESWREEFRKFNAAYDRGEPWTNLKPIAKKENIK